MLRRAWTRLTGVDPRLADGLLAVALALPAVVQFQSAGYWYGRTGHQVDIHTGAVLLMTLPVAIRRRHPLLCFGLISLGSLLILAQPPYTALLGAFIGLYSLAVHARSPWPAVVLLLVGSTVLGVALPGIQAQLPPAVLMLLVGFLALMAATAIRSRQAQAAMLEERARRLEHERELAARVAAGAERARIA